MQPQSDPKANRQITFMLMATLVMIALVWRGCWYGAPMSDSEISAALQGDSGEQETQRALSQVVTQIENNDEGHRSFFPAILALESHKTLQIRATVAWVMGRAKEHKPFTAALLRMVQDDEVLVRQNAALALAKLKRTEGRDIIIGMLLPSVVRASHDGEVTQLVRADEPIRAGMRVARIKGSDGTETDLHSPIDGKIKRADVALDEQVVSGDSIILVQPTNAQFYQALRGLMVVGEQGDLEAINQFLEQTGSLSEEVQLQGENLRKRLEAETTRAQPVR